MGGGSEGEPRPGAPQKRKAGAQSGRNLLEASRETWRFREGRGPASWKLFAAICEVQPLPISAGAQDVLQGVCPHPTPPDPGLSTLHCCQPCLPASLWDATHLEVSAHPHQTTHILRLEDLSPNATSSRSLPASCTHSFSPPDTVGLVLLCGAYHHISPLSDGRDPTSIPRPCPACPEPDSRTGVPDCWDQLAWLSSLN